MSQTPCLTCGRVIETDSDEHYRYLEPTATRTTILYFCSASCVADNAGLYDE